MAKKESMNRDYSGDGVVVQVREDENAYLYAMKEGEEVGHCLAIRVLDQQTKACLNEYWAELPSGGNMGSYHQFMKKFLKNPEFRESYRTDEKANGWQGVISFEVEDKGIDKRCQQQIHRLNGMKSPHFKDLMNLKTFGRDKVSSMKRTTLVEQLKETDVDLIEQELDDEKQQLTALRWLYRGLMPQLAIRKVLTDLEIANHMRR